MLKEKGIWPDSGQSWREGGVNPCRKEILIRGSASWGTRPHHPCTQPGSLCSQSWQNDKAQLHVPFFMIFLISCLFHLINFAWCNCKLYLCFTFLFSSSHWTWWPSSIHHMKAFNEFQMSIYDERLRLDIRQTSHKPVLGLFPETASKYIQENERYALKWNRQ